MKLGKYYQYFVIFLLCTSVAFANYTGKYGKVDNLEIGFDLFWGFIVNIVPFIFYILFGVFVLWLMYKSKLFD